MTENNFINLYKEINILYPYVYIFPLFFIISWFKMLKNLRFWENKYNNFIKKQDKSLEDFNLKYNQMKNKYNKTISFFLLTKNNLISENKKLSIETENLKNNLKLLSEEFNKYEKKIQEQKELVENLKIELSILEKENLDQQKIKKRNFFKSKFFFDLKKKKKIRKNTEEIDDLKQRKKLKRACKEKNYKGMDKDEEEEKNDENYVE